MRGSGPVSPGAQPPRLGLSEITFGADLKSFRHTLNDPTTILFIDLGPNIERLKHIPLNWQARVMLVLSPESSEAGQSIVKELKKTKRFIPVWNQAEIELMRRFIHPYDDERAGDAAAPVPGQGVCTPVTLAGEIMLPGLHAITVDHRFEQFGGVPRFVFDHIPRQLRTKLAYALSDCSLSAIVNGRLCQLGELGSMLFHYSVYVPAHAIVGQARAALLAAQRHASPDPRLPHADPLPFELQDSSLRVATSFMKQIIFNRYRRNKLDEVAKFLDHCIDDRHLATIRGDIFEPFAQHVMSKQGTQAYYVQQLDDLNHPSPTAVHGRIGPVCLTKMTVSGDVLPMSSLANFANLGANQYGKPVKGNLETLDGVIASNTTLQFKVTNFRSVTAGDLYDAEKELKGLMPAGSQSAFRLRHFFCVPRDRFDTYTLTAVNFQPTSGKSLPTNVDYFVLLMESPDLAMERGPPGGLGPAQCACTSASQCKKICPCRLANPPVKCIPGVCGCKSGKCKNR